MKITIENFLAFSEPVTFDLKKINLFIGANNCGKSTFAKFIELINHSISDKGKIHIRIPKSLQKQVTEFKDLLFDRGAKSKTFDTEIEFEIQKYRCQISLTFHETTWSHLDHYGKKYGGSGFINYFKINDQIILEKKNNQIRLSYSGLRTFEKIQMQLHEEERTINEYEFRIANRILIESNEVDHELWKTNDILIIDQETTNSGYFAKQEYLDYTKQFLIRILKNELKPFGLISHNSNTTELYFMERNWVDTKLKENFDIEIIEKDVILKNRDSHRSDEYWKTLLYAKANNVETQFDSMGLGFQTLFRFLMTTTLIGFDKHVNNDYLFPIFQEPEVGLHPDWQVKLFKLLVSKLAIIETHSLIILRALQLEVAEGNYNPEDVIIHNFYRDNNNVIRINPIRINKTGMLLGEFAKGFHEEISDIEMKLWQIQQKQINQN
jgi:predicted ATP-dependent endonuclease of OLD family